ncbi:MAG: helix-turn-helix domain-containing protein [Bacteroidales bacterium]|nr:helix-turn-helix domain-containing protein [Bacteroidales bacterium]MCF8328620.1 helix-turn-helix domain-containing protein [Bacteroidales bacterium]
MESEQSAALIASSYINSTNCHIFLTGKAGTGKTTFLKNIVERTHKSCIVAAPTGVAAINAGGVTLHSLFQLPFGAYVPEDGGLFAGEINSLINTPTSLKKQLKINSSKRQMLREMELLIIDEVSMLRADIMDAIDLVLRVVRRNRNTPFGGVQLLLIGDMLQLPPVVKNNEWRHLSSFYDSAYFFDSMALQQEKPVYIELEKIYRQSDHQFISLLSHLRDNQLTNEDMELLNQHYYTELSQKQKKGAVFLTTHNKQADSINRQHLDNLKGKAYHFHAEIKGDFPEYYYPLEETLTLKKGAQVMFIKNDYSGEQRYYNGKIGTVSELDNEGVTVSFDDEAMTVDVETYTWENKRFVMNKESGEIEEKINGEFKHFPLKLAWAITVHKSQGLTFDKAIIDVSKAFAPGQIYVALSRLRNLDGLILTNPMPAGGISPDNRLSEFAENKQEEEKLKEKLKHESFRYTQSYLLTAYNLRELSYQLQEHIKSYNKEENLSEKQKHKKWAIELKQKIDEPVKIAEKFQVQVRKLTSQPENTDTEQLKERVQAAKKYFEPLLNEFSESIHEHIAGLDKKKGTKKYVKELMNLEAYFFRQIKKLYKAEQLVEALNQNKELTKAEMKDVQNKLEQQHTDQLKHSAGNTKERKKKPKAVKGSSAAHSFELYQKYKNIEKIANERELAVTTIEGHLAQYVAKEKIPASDFVSKKKQEQIIKASKAVDSLFMNEIKAVLGDEFTYSDIRFTMAGYLGESSK